MQKKWLSDKEKNNNCAETKVPLIIVILIHKIEPEYSYMRAGDDCFTYYYFLNACI